MTDLERYVIEEHIEDFRDGLIDRRELLRRVGLITGSAAVALAVLASLGCGPLTGASAPPSAAPSAGVTKAYATPPPSGTTDGITVKPDDPRIKAENVTVKAGDGASLTGYLARPASGKRAPGVLVCHENRGLTEHIRDVIRRLATAGFVGAGIELLSRQGGTGRLTDPAAYAAELTKRQTGDMVTDLRAALDYLKGQSFVAGDRLGAVGFCFGGGMVWNLVAAGAELKAAVPFYGPPPQRLDALAGTRVAVLGIYAEQDTRITSSMASVEEQLKKSGRPYELKIYSGANHAFHNDTGQRYVPAQAQQAWVQTIEWLRRYLL
jgi:carboxymethylenebutenolidase